MTGMVLFALIKKIGLPLQLELLLIIMASILSHGLLDKLSILTYHPELPLYGDMFWEEYHYKILPIATAVAGITAWNECGPVILFTIIPDLDWILRSYLEEKPILHNIVFCFWNWLPSLPDWRLKRSGVIVELILILLLWSAYQQLNLSPHFFKTII